MGMLQGGEWQYTGDIKREVGKIEGTLIVKGEEHRWRGGVG